MKRQGFDRIKHSDIRLSNILTGVTVMRIPLKTTVESRCEQQCGGCTACCNVLCISESVNGIDDADGLAEYKPNWQDCPHQCNGCKIYGSHPDECKSYWCLFTSGAFGKDISYRPDKLGLIFDFRGIEEIDFSFLQAWETRPGAQYEKRAKATIETLLSKSGIVIRRYKLPLSKLEVYGTREQQSDIIAFLTAQFIIQYNKHPEMEAFADATIHLTTKEKIEKFCKLIA